ncbi:MAG: AI-2E family transporter [Mesorhizobium sp.]|nr:MAG: AI-2E family transporter [Mesorhizobium sp.]
MSCFSFFGTERTCTGKCSERSHSRLIRSSSSSKSSPTCRLPRLKGTFIVGLVQGALGGLIFAVLGINGAVFWGAVMAMVSVLPAVGTALIWVPAAVILIVGGAWIKGLILSAFGTFVISMSDNGLAANGSGSPDEDARLFGALLHLGRAQCPWHQRLRLGTCGRRAVYGGLATH